MSIIKTIFGSSVGKQRIEESKTSGLNAIHDPNFSVTSGVVCGETLRPSRRQFMRRILFSAATILLVFTCSARAQVKPQPAANVIHEVPGKVQLGNVPIPDLCYVLLVEKQTGGTTVALVSKGGSFVARMIAPGSYTAKFSTGTCLCEISSAVNIKDATPFAFKLDVFPVTVSVKDANGAPLQAAHIVLTAEDATATLTATSDANGQATIALAKASTYRLIAFSNDNKVSSSKRVTIDQKVNASKSLEIVVPSSTKGQ